MSLVCAWLPVHVCLLVLVCVCCCSFERGVVAVCCWFVFVVVG